MTSNPTIRAAIALHEQPFWLRDRGRIGLPLCVRVRRGSTQWAWDEAKNASRSPRRGGWALFDGKLPYPLSDVSRQVSAKGISRRVSQATPHGRNPGAIPRPGRLAGGEAGMQRLDRTGEYRDPGIARKAWDVAPGGKERSMNISRDYLIGAGSVADGVIIGSVLLKIICG